MLEPARQILRYRSLLATLTGRELKARYRGSLLGYVWSLANPLLLLAVYAFVFGFVFRPRFEGADPYALFLICGLFPWLWASASLLEGSAAFVASGGLLRKAVFPLELLPLVPVLSNLVHLLLALPVLAGGALALAALNVHFKDVRDLVSNLLTLFFFLTPILFPLEAVPHPALWWLVRSNPFTPFTLGYQQTLFFGVFPDAELWAQMALVSLVSWLVGAWIFGRLRETLVEAA
jgi:ABC-type polysaccharide/polyol phosphate export permease